MNERDYMVDDGELEEYKKKRDLMSGLAGVSDAMNSGHSFGEFMLGRLAEHKPIQPGVDEYFKNNDPRLERERSANLLAKYQAMKTAQAGADLDQKRYLLDKFKVENAPKEKAAEHKFDLDKLAEEYRLKGILEGNKKQADLAGLAAPGYSLNGTVKPSEDEAKKFRNAIGKMNGINASLDAYGNLIDKYGSYENGGEGGQKMSTLASDLQLQLKSPEFYELGVLTGPDLGLLQGLVPDPTSSDSLFTRDKNAKVKLGTLKNLMNERLSNKAASMGYNKQQSPQSPQDLEAIEWAKANRQDPRATQILQMHGVQ